MSATVYQNLKDALEVLNLRQTSYRFNLLEDVAWNRLAEPGNHYTSAPDAPNDAKNLFQWSAALEYCNTYHLLYAECLEFIDNESQNLGPTRSMLLLYQEKRKHQNMLNLYRDYLRSTQPAHLTAFDKHYSLKRPAKS